MNSGQMIFTQVMDVMPLKIFHRCVSRYDGDFSVKHFNCLEQFRVMAFAQMTYRESLRVTVTCLRAQTSKLYRMGIRSTVSKSTLADANEVLKKRLKIEASLYTILQILSVSVFERTDLNQLLAFYNYRSKTTPKPKQLNLFLNYSGH